MLNIKNKENLEAANQIMLSPASGKGEQLFNAINSFRERILKMVTDERQKAIIASNLTTTLPKTRGQWVKTGRNTCSRICLWQRLLRF